MHSVISKPIVPALLLAGAAMPGAISVAATDTVFVPRDILSGSFQRAYEDDFSRNVPLTDRARSIYNALTLLLFNQAGPDVVVADEGWLFTAEEFRTALDTIDLVEELAKAKAHLDALQIRLVPVIVPDKARIYADHLPRPRDEALENRYADALDLLSASGFTPIDLQNALIDGRAVRDTFMRTDTHWSPWGAERAAAEVAQQTQLVATSPSAYETVLSDEGPFVGDLMTFVDTGPFASWVGPAPETLALPVTTATAPSGGLFGDVDIDIVLVGTSFSARTEFNFDGFLKQKTGLELVNLAVEGQGPFAPMRDAIEQDSFASLSPTVVIWEIPERYLHIRSSQ